MSQPPSPRATIVVPCYNHAHFLEECLRSLVAQTEERWEALVIDDASPDGDEIAAVVERVGDPRVRVIRHARNKGLGGSRNTGFAAAACDLVLTIDADDKLVPEALASLLPALEADPELDLVYGDYQLFGRDEQVLVFPGPPDGRPVLRAEHTLPGAGSLMRRPFWERVGRYDEAEVLRRGREDFEFYVRASGQGIRFRRVPGAFYLYRIHHTSMSFACKLHDDEIAAYIYAKHRALFDAGGESARFLCLASQNAATAAHERGLRGRALRNAWRAWRLIPSRGRLKACARTLVTIDTAREIDRGEWRARLPFRGYPLHGAARHAPFFVIGVGRSGNTLFRRILTAHSELHIPPETFVLGSVLEDFPRVARHSSWPDLVQWVLGRFAFHAEWHTFDAELGPLARRLAEVPPEERNLATILDGFFRYHGEVHGTPKKRWGDKTPLNSLDQRAARGKPAERLGRGTPRTLERLARVFPDARFVHIYRDGVDNVYSHLRGGFFADAEDAAKRWLHVVRQCANFCERHPDRSLAVRYEDLVRDTERVVRDTCAFLGVAFEEPMLRSEKAAARMGDVPEWSWHAQVGKPVNAQNPGKGRAFLTAREKDLVQHLIGSELARLGYPPATETP